MFYDNLLWSQSLHAAAVRLTEWCQLKKKTLKKLQIAKLADKKNGVRAFI